MKLFIKRDKSEKNARFRVFDEQGYEKYTVTGEVNSGGYKMNVSACRFDAKVKIRKLPLALFNTFLIFDSKDLIRLIIMQNSSKVLALYHGISWRIRGDILSKNFDIADADNRLVASHICRWGRNEDCCELTVFDTQREMFALASVLVINSFNLEKKEALQTV